METNFITEVMRVLNWAQINGAPATEQAATEILVKAMSPILSDRPLAIVG